MPLRRKDKTPFSFSFKIHSKGMIFIISVSRGESIYIREKNPKIQQVVLNKHAPARKREYLVTNDHNVGRLIKQYRRDHAKVIESHYEREDR